MVSATSWNPWKALENSLTLDFKDAWKAFEKKNFCRNCLKIVKTRWILARMGNDLRWYLLKVIQRLSADLKVLDRFCENVLLNLCCCLLGEILHCVRYILGSLAEMPGGGKCFFNTDLLVDDVYEDDWLVQGVKDDEQAVCCTESLNLLLANENVSKHSAR